MDALRLPPMRFLTSWWPWRSLLYLASGSALGRMVVLLEENRDRLAIEHYSVSPTTLDQVFLTIVGSHNVQEENYGGAKRRRWWMWPFE